MSIIEKSKDRKAEQDNLKFRGELRGNENYGNYYGGARYTPDNGLANFLLEREGGIDMRNLSLTPGQTSFGTELLSDSGLHTGGIKYTKSDIGPNKYGLQYNYNKSNDGLYAGLAAHGVVGNPEDNRYEANVGYRF